MATALLALKPWLHGWIARLEQLELTAGIELLVISVVLLPLLPDRGYGPGGVLNPYALWWIVVLVAGLSFLGYIAIRLAGPRVGTLLSGVLGGLTSSTAISVAFGRMGRRHKALQPALAAAVVAASAMMFPRIMVIAGLLNWQLIPGLAWPLGIMSVAGLTGVVVLYRAEPGTLGTEATGLPNPLELGVALRFGAALTVIVLLAELAREWAGTEGLYAVAALAGLTDVDAMTVSMARMSDAGAVGLGPAASAIVIAAFVNTVIKAGIVAVLCGGGMALRVGIALGAVVAAGAAALLLPV